MNKLIRPNLIQKVPRQAPTMVTANSGTFISTTNAHLQTSAAPTSTAINISESSTAKFPVSVGICALLKNNEMEFSNIVGNIRTLQSYFAKSFVIFVESGSTDKTAELFSKVENSLFIHLDSDATEAEQRNAYLSVINNNVNLFNVMIVVDPKIALMKPIDSSIFSCFVGSKYHSWDALFANQSYKYYDIASLRSKDCPSDLSELNEHERSAKIRSLKMHIPRDEKMIPVASAFGGLALYKTSYLNRCEYKNDGHVSFNVLLYRQTKSMFIDPSLVLETLEENAGLYL